MPLVKRWGGGSTEDKIDKPNVYNRNFIPGGEIRLTRHFAFSRDKGQYENCK